MQTDIAARTGPSASISWREPVERALPWLVAVWVVGVVALSLRLTGGWLTARRLRTAWTTPAPEACLAMLARLAQRLRVTRPVRLLQSAMVQVPAVIGWLTPVILVPASALTGLTPQQLEALLAHELAHVRRHDYLVNLAQAVVETLLFYHPAVWWVSRRIRAEREHCCDDVAVAVCGDAHFYATALLGMERLRGAPALAMAASGGSLAQRIERLVAPSLARAEFFPRWSAGVVALTVVLAIGGGSRLSGAPAGRPEPSPRFASDSGGVAPDTVLKAPDATKPLADRWEWARSAAAAAGRGTYWVGYKIRRPAGLERSVYIDRHATIVGDHISMSGHLMGDFRGLMFPGVRLAPLTGTPDSDDLAVLFGFSPGAGGRPQLAAVHVGSFFLPVDFGGRALFWLGDASDGESLPLVQQLFATVRSPDLREDLVAAAGVHSSSEAVVPILTKWLQNDGSSGVRAQAAEWLGIHAVAPAVNALARAARGDGSNDVRREAAEALGDNRLPAATDSVIAVARSAQDPDTRREATEGLAQKDDPRALTTLVSIATGDPNEDVEREAVETLGEVKDGRGLPELLRLARAHPRADVRREAVETIGEAAPVDQALTVLQDIARTDPNTDVQREAVETLGELKDGAGLAAVIDLARTHPQSDVRREAVETIGEHAPSDATVTLLDAIAQKDRSEDVQRQAVETLGQMEGGIGLAKVIDIARHHGSAEVRREAVETIGEAASPDQAFMILSDIARQDADPDVQREAVETLGEIHDSRAVAVLQQIARSHPSTDVRRKAIETLGQTSPDSARALLERIAGENDDPDVQREAVETLGELDDPAALAAVARVARTHPDDDVRRKAIETFTEHASPAAALALLKDLLASDASEDVLSQALESLVDLPDGMGIAAAVEVARAHPNPEIRKDALRRLAESDDPRARAVFERALLPRP